MASPLSDLIWSVADLLRGDYKQSDYGKVILPFTLLRRLDCVLEPTKQVVLDEFVAKADTGELMLDRALLKAAGQSFYNTSRHTLATMLGEPNELKQNLLHYVNEFSAGAHDVFARYKFAEQVEFLASKNLLYLVLQKFVAVDLRPLVVSNADMGAAFEELIRKFAELSNETAGEHFTPREVIRLMVNLLFCEDTDALTKPGVIRTLYDCCAGTGGMLSVADEHLRAMNPQASLKAFGQELNEESYAICKADMLIKGQDVKNIIQGNTLSHDGLPDKKFDYMLTNPPFGVEWKKVQKEVEAEHEKRGFAGRFGPGLPRVSDGSLLFLMHLMSKMRPADEGGSRIAIVLNGSPLFTGGAGSGESEIRKYVLENDLLEAIVALPTDMFYNTGIATYIWVLTNHKVPTRKGKVQLINAVDLWKKMKKSLGSKRKELGDDHIDQITQIFGRFEEGEISKVVPSTAFGYSTITVERPLRQSIQFTVERIGAFFGSPDFERLCRLPHLVEKTENLPGGLGSHEFAAMSGNSWAVGSAGPKEVEINRKALELLLGEKLIGRKFLSETELGTFINSSLAGRGIQVARTAIAKLAGLFLETDPDGSVVPAKGKKKAVPFEPDVTLRDTENVPLADDIEDYFRREVLPHVPDAYIDHSKTKVGYEIPFTRYFYQYKPPRPLEEIDRELKAKTDKILKMLGEIAG